MKQQDRFKSVVVFLVASVGVLAFVLSYNALYLMASQHGHNGVLAFLWPLIIDLPLVVLTLVMLYGQVNRWSKQAIVTLLLLVIGYTILTGLLNYLESDGSLGGVIVRVSAPAGLFICTEVLRHLFKFEMERQAVLDSIEQLETRREKNLTAWQQSQKELNDILSQIDRARSQLDEISVKTDKRNHGKLERQENFKKYLLDNPMISVSKAANAVGIARTTAYKYRDNLVDTGQLVKNGKGWQVSET